MNIDFDSIVALISGSLGIIATFLAVLNYIINTIKQGRLKELVNITLKQSKEFLGQGDNTYKVLEQKYLEQVNKYNELIILIGDKEKDFNEKIQALNKEIESLDKQLKDRAKQLEKIQRKLK